MKRGVSRPQFILPWLIVLSGCASSGPPLPPSLELPKPVSDLRALRKGNQVYLAWTEPAKTTDQQAIRSSGPTLICRSRASAMRECGTPIVEVPAASATEKTTAGKPAPLPETTAAYTDHLAGLPGVQPADEITYAVEVLNHNQRGAGLSNQVRVPLFPAVPPPAVFGAEVTAQGVKISWSCQPSPPQIAGIEYRFRIYRRQEGSSDEDKIAEASLADCQGSPVLDTSFQWEKTYKYRGAVVSIISVPGQSALEIEGDDTPSVRVFADDVFPPAVPTGLQAVFSGPGQPPFVDLIWSPDTDADLAGYNVYRRDPGGQPAKLNSELINAPAYRDPSVQSGKTYFYSVSAVDVRGNETARSKEASEQIP